MKKFNNIVGNPPFNDLDRSGNALWPIFIEKANDVIKDSGYISLVMPVFNYSTELGWQVQIITNEGKGYVKFMVGYTHNPDRFVSYETALERGMYKALK